jgi:hypothetical protein
LKRLTACLAAALCCALLGAPTALAGASASKTKPLIITNKAATRYATKATTEYFEQLKPLIIPSGKTDIEQVITDALGKVEPCRRTSPTHFHCHYTLTATIRTYTGGELTGEETKEVSGQETLVLVEKARAVTESEHAVVFPLKAGWKAYVRVF